MKTLKMMRVMRVMMSSMIMKSPMVCTNVAAVLFLIHCCTIIAPLIAPPLPGILEGQYTDFFYITHHCMIIYRHC